MKFSGSIAEAMRNLGSTRRDLSAEDQAKGFADEGVLGYDVASNVAIDTDWFALRQ